MGFNVLSFQDASGQKLTYAQIIQKKKEKEAKEAAERAAKEAEEKQAELANKGERLQSVIMNRSSL